MFSSFLPKTPCLACSNMIEQGNIFCACCGRSRGLFSKFQTKQWELVLIASFTLVCLCLCGSSSIIFRPQNIPQAPFTQTATAYYTSTSTPTIAPIGTPTKLKTQVPTQTPKEIIPTSTDVIIGYAKISREVYRVNLRKSAGYLRKDDSVDVIVEIPQDSPVKLLGGPQKTDGLNWWYVEWNGYKGWLAERTASGKKILIFQK